MTKDYTKLEKALKTLLYRVKLSPQQIKLQKLYEEHKRLSLKYWHTNCNEWRV